MNLKFTKRQHQTGNFSVEFAIVGVFFSLLLVFSADVIIKLSIKGKLDRMAYSAASVIKERTELFAGILDVDESNTQQGERTYDYVQASLGRTIGNFDPNAFGFSLDVYTFDGSNVTSTNAYTASALTCTVNQPSDDLFITTGWGTTLTLYQVTLCYETDNWFGDLIDVEFNRVNTYAAVMGR
ncbi:tight adherence pilus pseudopilin TadF [Vibrio sp. WJH972]